VTSGLGSWREGRRRVGMGEREGEMGRGEGGVRGKE
jgi:hypothetical protein